MLVNCPICSEILLPSDFLSTTPCGHIFHQSCVNRWLSSNSTCPQCRQECSQQNTHRIYLPEVNFQDNDQLIERMNELNRLKMEAESKAKKIETDKKSLERDLKKRKKEFHKVMQRAKSLRKNGPSTSSHIPSSQRYKSATVNIFVGSAQVQSGANKDQNTVATRPKKKRNQSRTERCKAYFLRKRAERDTRNPAEPERIEIADSPDVAVISVSSEDSSSN